jgi:hypothetical protein
VPETRLMHAILVYRTSCGLCRMQRRYRPLQLCYIRRLTSRSDIRVVMVGLPQAHGRRSASSKSPTALRPLTAEAVRPKSNGSASTDRRVADPRAAFGYDVFHVNGVDFDLANRR